MQWNINYVIILTPIYATAVILGAKGIASLDKRTTSRIRRSPFLHLVFAHQFTSVWPNDWPAPRRVERPQRTSLLRLLQPPHRDVGLCRRWWNYQTLDANPIAIIPCSQSEIREIPSTATTWSRIILGYSYLRYYLCKTRRLQINCRWITIFL